MGNYEFTGRNYKFESRNYEFEVSIKSMQI